MDDAMPSSSRDNTLSPVKKRRRISVSAEEKKKATNVYKYICEVERASCDPVLLEKPTKEALVTKTAEVLGISKRTMYSILKENEENEDFTSPQKRGPKLSFRDKLDEFDLTAIRRKVHEFYFANEAPTIVKVHKAVNDDPDLPNFSKSTIRLILKHLNFKYASRKRKSCLIDRQDIIVWRKRYLMKIQDYRREGKFLYYQDETWVNEGHTVKKTWIDTNIESPRQAFLEGYSTGLKDPKGKGRRLIISHIGSEEGFVEGGLLMFESKKNMDDYHQEMNAEHFEEWLRGVLPKLKKDSVLILDNAPYHSRRLEKTPTTAWRKSQIQQWLNDKNIEYVPSMVKAELLEIVRKEKGAYQKQAVEELAAEYGVTILRLPPYHCELNPIELVWAQVKGHVARNNKTFKLKEVQELIEEGLKEVTPQRWKSCIGHVIDIEKKMSRLDHIIDDVCDRFIISVTDSDSENSSSDIEE